MNYLTVMGQAIRRARRMQGFTIEELSDHAGLHVNTISAIERGIHDCSASTMTRLLLCLGCESIHFGHNALDIDFSLACNKDMMTILQSMPDSLKIRFMGQAVHARRIAMGYSLDDLSALAHVHINTLWNLEHSLVNPSSRFLYSVHRALGTHHVKADKNGLHLS